MFFSSTRMNFRLTYISINELNEETKKPKQTTELNGKDYALIGVKKHNITIERTANECFSKREHRNV